MTRNGWIQILDLTRARYRLDRNMKEVTTHKNCKEDVQTIGNIIWALLMGNIPFDQNICPV